MPDCREIEPLLSAYVDGEAPVADRLMVTVHAGECDECRRRLAAESAARDVLRNRARAVSAAAPDRLRRHCEGLRETVPPLAAQAPLPAPRPSWFRVPRLSWSMAAAAVVVVIGLVIGAWVASGSSTALAAELTLDHLKCFTLFAHPERDANREALEAELAVTYGWHLHVPPASPADGLRLIGARRCVTTDGRMAHLLYVHNGHHLSVFVMPNVERANAAREMIGYRTVVWSRGGMTYAVVADEPGSDIERVATYIRQNIQG